MTKEHNCLTFLSRIHSRNYIGIVRIKHYRIVKKKIIKSAAGERNKQT